MLNYELEKKLVPEICCEICGNDNSKTIPSEIKVKSIKEFHKDGTSKIHYTCSKHIVALYKKITKEIEQDQKLSI